MTASFAQHQITPETAAVLRMETGSRSALSFGYQRVRVAVIERMRPVRE
jgi:hypothetical protein